MAEKIDIFGKWFYSVTEEELEKAEKHGKFPPKGAEYLGMLPGDEDSEFEDIPDDTLEYYKQKEGATHVMIAYGQVAEVYTIDGETILWERDEED